MSLFSNFQVGIVIKWDQILSKHLVYVCSKPFNKIPIFVFWNPKPGSVGLTVNHSHLKVVSCHQDDLWKVESGLDSRTIIISWHMFSRFILLRVCVKSLTRQSWAPGDGWRGLLCTPSPQGTLALDTTWSGPVGMCFFPQEVASDWWSLCPQSNASLVPVGCWAEAPGF